MKESLDEALREAAEAKQQAQVANRIAEEKAAMLAEMQRRVAQEHEQRRAAVVDHKQRQLLHMLSPYPIGATSLHQRGCPTSPDLALSIALHLSTPKGP